MSKMIIQITTASDNIERASLGFLVGNVSLASNQETVVLLTVEGVRLAVEGYAEGKQADGFDPLKDLIDKFVQSGGRMMVCGACAKPRDITQDMVVEGAQVVGAATAVEYMASGAASFVA